MAPSMSTPTTDVLLEYYEELTGSFIPPETQKPENRKVQLVWSNIMIFVYLHTVSLYGLYLMLTSAKGITIFYTTISLFLGGFGITAGAHRLWSHRAYKAKWPLKLFLVYCNTLQFENSVIEWSRDHRVHHKFSETDADPHNANRGFFFSHMGWLMCKKHPEVKNKGKQIDLSDLYNEPILKFQHDHYLKLMPMICFIMPTMIPMYFWNETFMNAFTLNVLRYVFGLHSTWLINSAAHLRGNKPYDKLISGTENKMASVFALGEGWHNYHHTFPWDYKTAELGQYSTNFTTALIDFFAKIGWAYELKTVAPEMVEKRVKRTGDGTHNLWGWSDEDQAKEDYEATTILYKQTNGQARAE